MCGAPYILYSSSRVREWCSLVKDTIFMSRNVSVWTKWPVWNNRKLYKKVVNLIWLKGTIWEAIWCVPQERRVTSGKYWISLDIFRSTRDTLWTLITITEVWDPVCHCVVIKFSCALLNIKNFLNCGSCFILYSAVKISGFMSSLVCLQNDELGRIWRKVVVYNWGPILVFVWESEENHGYLSG
jgi:hypothetical protein